MNITIQDHEKNQKKLLISLSPEDMKPYLQSAAQARGKNITIKGFRKGAAPYDVLEKSIGKEALWHEASADAIEQSYGEALKKHNLQPVGNPRVDITKSVPGNNFEFSVLVPLEPAFELPQYREIARDIVKKNKKTEITVDEHEVEEALNTLAKSRSTQGEDKEVKLDDEFAKSMGAFKTLEHLKESIREGIRKEQEQQRVEALRLKIIEAIRKETSMEVADLLIDNELTRMRDDLERHVASLDMSFDDYLKKAGQTREQLNENWKDKAKGRVEASFILKAIADAEDINPSSEEIEEHANRYLSGFDSPEHAESSIHPDVLRSHIRGMIRNDKVFNFLEKGDST